MAKIKKSLASQKRQPPNILVENADRSKAFSKASIKKMIRLILQSSGVSCETLAVHFVTKKSICKLHLDFFNDPSPTDCISFPVDPPSKSGTSAFLGEIVVCPSVAWEYAQKNGKDPRLELILYVIHGLLHLLGFDDLSPRDRKKMRLKEKECLQLLAKNQLIDENALNKFLSSKQ